MDWEASSASRVTLQGDLYDGRIAQDSGGDIGVSGGNVIAKWSRTLSERSSLAAHLYYDRTHRDIPGVFGEDLDTYDVDLQHSARLGARHDVVWGLGRSEEHTSELQSRLHLVCRLLLEKKKRQ